VKVNYNLTSQIFLYLLTSLVVITTFQCTNDSLAEDDEVQEFVPDFIEFNVNGQLQKDGQLIELDINENITENFARIDQKGGGAGGLGSYVQSGVRAIQNPSNPTVGIVAIACDQEVASGSIISLDRMRNAFNSGIEDGIIHLRVYINEEKYSNVNLEYNFFYSGDCSILGQNLDTEAIFSQSVGENDSQSGLLYAPVNFDYTGYLYNSTETDSIFTEDLSITFPVFGF